MPHPEVIESPTVSSRIGMRPPSSPPPNIIAGEARDSPRLLEIPWFGEPGTSAAYSATPDQVEAAIQSAHQWHSEAAVPPAHQRANILAEVSRRIRTDADELARLIVGESGKTIREARLEVGRAAQTFDLAAGEATRIGGHVIPADVTARGDGRIALTRLFPIGPVLGITSFNAPLNVVAHKLAPAIAAGNPCLIKPSSRGPHSALQLAQYVLEAGWPPEAISVFLSDIERIEELVADPRVRMVSLTGSIDVGWRLRGMARAKRITLELGGNAGVIVFRDADLAVAASRCCAGAFALAGQSCISVQRIFVERAVLNEFTDLFLREATALIVGDPWDEGTDVGPMIDDGAAARAEQWVSEAIGQGARALTGPKRHGAYFWPTVITDTSPDMLVCSREVFAPVVVIEPFDALDEAVAAINASRFGLQAGVFTPRLSAAFAMHKELQVGGVVVNDVPTFRLDHLPYGGTKESGVGKEGVRYAVEEMSELKLLLVDPLISDG